MSGFKLNSRFIFCSDNSRSFPAAGLVCPCPEVTENSVNRIKNMRINGVFNLVGMGLHLGDRPNFHKFFLRR